MDLCADPRSNTRGGCLSAGIYVLLFHCISSVVSREEPKAEPVPVSLIVCARNELENLQEHLPLWLKQDHPEFELIVVNDRSWDTSEAFLDEEAVKDKRLRAIHLHDHDRDVRVRNSLYNWNKGR